MAVAEKGKSSGKKSSGKKAPARSGRSKAPAKKTTSSRKTTSREQRVREGDSRGRTVERRTGRWDKAGREEFGKRDRKGTGSSGPRNEK
jgi:hypothetical protein